MSGLHPHELIDPHHVGQPHEEARHGEAPDQADERQARVVGDWPERLANRKEPSNGKRHGCREREVLTPRGSPRCRRKHADQNEPHHSQPAILEQLETDPHDRGGGGKRKREEEKLGRGGIDEWAGHADVTSRMADSVGEVLEEVTYRCHGIGGRAADGPHQQEADVPLAVGLFEAVENSLAAQLVLLGGLDTMDKHQEFTALGHHPRIPADLRKLG